MKRQIGGLIGCERAGRQYGISVQGMQDTVIAGEHDQQLAVVRKTDQSGVGVPKERVQTPLEVLAAFWAKPARIEATMPLGKTPLL